MDGSSNSRERRSARTNPILPLLRRSALSRERGSLPCYPRLTCFESCAYSCKRRGSTDFGLGERIAPQKQAKMAHPTRSGARRSLSHSVCTRGVHLRRTSATRAKALRNRSASGMTCTSVDHYHISLPRFELGNTCFSVLGSLPSLSRPLALSRSCRPSAGENVPSLSLP